MKKIKHFINDFVSNHKKTVALASILTVAGVGDVLGQTSPWVVRDAPHAAAAVRERTMLNQDVAPMSINASAFAKLSASEIARFSPFIEFGPSFRVMESRLSLRYEREANHLMQGPGGVRPYGGWRPFQDTYIDLSSPERSLNFFFTAGADFRITNNNLIRVSGGTEGWYGGFIRRQPLSRTMSMDFQVGFGMGRDIQRASIQGADHTAIVRINEMDQSHVFQKISAGIRLRKNLGHNISAEAGVSFARNIGYESTSPSIGEQLNEARRRETGTDFDLPIPTPDRTVPLNNLNFSIGIHKNFRVGNVPQVTLERRQRQPRRTAITCPHMQPRPWETVQPFNHPIAR